MDWRSWRVCIAPGDGVIAREGAAVVVAQPGREEQEQFLDELLVLCTDAARESPAGTLEMLVRRVGALVTQSAPEDVPSFGLLTTAPDGLAALLVGDVELAITTENGAVETLRGRDATTYVDRVLRGAVQDVLLTHASSSVPDVRSNLSGGVVRGSGVLLIPGRRAATIMESEETLVDLAPTAVAPASMAPNPGPPAPILVASAADSPPTTAFTAIELTEPAAGDSEPQAFISIALTEPMSVDDRESVNMVEDLVDEVATADIQAIQVQGIVCSRGHFNNPSARFCSRCGISTVHQTHNLVMGVRPPLGVVVVDDGAVFALTTDYVMGREPENADDVLSGKAVALPLTDPDLVMSRVHARILLDGWEARIEDADSANGTFVARSPEAAWVRLEPGIPTTIQPGTRVSLGGRTLVFESHQNT